MTAKSLDDYDKAQAGTKLDDSGSDIPAASNDLAGKRLDSLSTATPGREVFWHISEDLLAIATRNGVLIDINPSWDRVFGPSATEALGKHFSAVAHPDDAHAIASALANPHQSGTSPAFTIRIRTDEPDDRHFKCRVSLAQGRLHISARDITEEYRRDLALHDSKDFTRLAMSAVNGVGVWTYEVASDCFFCDEAVSALYGVDPVEAAAGIKRERFLANIHPDDRAPLRATMSGGLIESGDLELEYRICHPDGSIRHVLSKGHTYFTEDGTPWRRTGVGIDMTRQRELEQQLQQSQKMDAVGHLTGGIAHDFNNMLQGIIGPLELIKRLHKLGRTNEIDRFVDMSTTSAHRAAALTHRLLAFSRRQPLAAASVDVPLLIGSLETLIRQSVRENVVISIVNPAQSCVVRCDPHQLENALVNLAINARDAMPEGGTLTFEVSLRDVAQNQAQRYAGVEAGRYVCIAVSDTGIGMPPKVLEQVFEPFFTTKPLGQGTGLGLSMVYGFVGQSGGFVALESEVGVGTSVQLYLPENITADRTSPRLAKKSVQTQDGKGETILIADDDETIRALLSEVFERSGYRTLIAENGPSGLAILRSEVAIDLLLTDVGLPGLNGRQLADAARIVRPHLPIVFMTGYAEVAQSGEFLEDGMQLLTKPFPLDAALASVRAMLTE